MVDTDTDGRQEATRRGSLFNLSKTYGHDDKMKGTVNSRDLQIQIIDDIYNDQDWKCIQYVGASLMMVVLFRWWCRPAKYSFSLCKINSAALALVERISINNIDHLFHQ